MAEFISKTNPDITTVVRDNEDIQLCPNCFFPNKEDARECIVCKYAIQDGNARWLKAAFVRPCGNPDCTAFVFSRDTQCPKCGHPIENEQPTPSAAPAGSGESAETPRYVLICPECHTENQSNAMHCSNCGAPLDDGLLEEAGTKMICFRNLKTGRRIQLSLPLNGSAMVGREGALSEQFPADGDQTNVSRVHMTLLNRNGQVFIRDEHSTNGTYVNGREVAQRTELLVKSGSVIELGPNARDNMYSEYFELTY